MCTFLHLQVKDSLFKNPVAGAILLNAGNIPVDRKTKNNQILFRGTFEGASASLDLVFDLSGTRASR